MNRIVLFVLLCAMAAVAKPVYPPETDIASPRHSALGAEPHGRILRTDLDDDGDPEIIERWWNGTRVRWFDENDDAASADVWGDMVLDAMQVDADGDGFYDGPLDYNVKWADTNEDGIPDVQIFNRNPQEDKPNIFANSGVYYVTIDRENTGLLVDISWDDLTPSWIRYQKGPNWNCNYHGNAAFLKEHIPIWAVENPEFSWENPFLFFDPDEDGCAEVSVRVEDIREFLDESRNSLRFDGIVDSVWLSYDLDNDSGRDNEKDYDLTLYVHGSPGIDYKKDIHVYSEVKAPDWAEPYYRNFAWRQQDRFVYLRREKAVKNTFEAKWKKAYLTFDEDDDCHRWERVELYLPGDPYFLKRGQSDSVIRHPQSDSLGDRGEWDEDFSGEANIYFAAWDGKVHLAGAERGAWMVDRNRAYWGAIHPNGVASTKTAEKAEEVIQYRDSDNNGFFDTIIYDYDGDKVPDRTDSLIELGIDDRCKVFNAGQLGWDGLRKENNRMTLRSWKQAQRLYRLAFRYGFVDPEIHALAKASSIGEKQDKAYWLKESILRKLLAVASSFDQKTILTAYYSNDLETMGTVMNKQRR